MVPARLLDLFEEGVRAGVLVVSGPAGAGKTELAAWWALRHGTRDVAWLTLDEGDRDPGRLVRYIVAAIRSTRDGRATEELASLPRWSSPSEGYLAAVQDGLSHLRHDVVLVLDDFDHLAGSASERLLRAVFRYPPDRVRVVVVSRIEPELGQAEHWLRGHGRQIRGSDLALTLEESRAVLDANKVILNDAVLESIQGQTRGWVTGLRLMMPFLPASPDEVSGAAAIHAGTIAAGDYLVDEVLDVQAPDLRQFLLRTAVVDVVCGGLARGLTDRADAGEVLAMVSRANLFLARLDDNRDERCRSYGWHPMFAAALRARLRDADPDLQATLHRTASRWLDANGSPLGAVRHALAGGDVEAAIETVGRSWLDLLVGGEPADLRTVLELFDDRQRASSPELAVACGALRARDGHLDLASRCAGRAALLAPDLPLRRRRAVEVMATVVALHHATMTGTGLTDDVMDEARARLRAIDARGRFLTRTDRLQRVLLRYHLGALLVSTWRAEEAAPELDEALAEAERLDVPDVAGDCRAQLALVELLAGRLDSSRAAAQTVIDGAAAGTGDRSELAIAHLALGGVALLRHELGAALDHLTRAAAVVPPEDRVTQFRIRFLRQVALRTAGEVRAAGDEVEHLGRLLDGWDAPGWATAMAGVTRADHLRVQRPGDALELISSGSPPGCEPPLRHLWSLAGGWLLLELGRVTEARQALAHVTAADVPSPLRAAALVLDARAADLAGGHDEALDNIDVALGVAAPERLVLPFVLAGPSIRQLLDELVDRGTAHESDAVAILDHLAGDDRRGRALVWPTVEPLTRRELEVLRLLRGTARNEEIAAQLYVSLNTLRTHLKHINQKLGTHDRREAARRARELGII